MLRRPFGYASERLFQAAAGTRTSSAPEASQRPEAAVAADPTGLQSVPRRAIWCRSTLEIRLPGARTRVIDLFAVSWLDPDRRPGGNTMANLTGSSTAEI